MPVKAKRRVPPHGNRRPVRCAQFGVLQVVSFILAVPPLYAQSVAPAAVPPVPPSPRVAAARAQSVPAAASFSDAGGFAGLIDWRAGGWRPGDPRPSAARPGLGSLDGGGVVVQEAPDAPAPAPAIASLSGYMDFHFNNAQHEDAKVDFHRFVLLFTHRFSDRVRFVSELELEHAFVEGREEAGELELEQAYIDFLVTREFNLRAGMLLVPVGIINERHEPPVYHGVERPFVDTLVVPSTWFEGGAGVHGEIGGGFRYRAYVMAPLDAAGFSAEEGLRGGRQKGAEATARNVASTGRVEYVGTRGLQAGASFWRGRTGFSFPRVESQVTLGEADARYRVGELETRAQYAHVWLDGMGALNRALQRTVGISPNVARQIRGFYLEASYFVSPLPAPREAAVFVRYENFDTQHRMPAGFQPLPQFDRDAWVFGVSYYPDPDVVLKFDYSVVRNRSRVVDAPDSLNVGLGWWF